MMISTEFFYFLIFFIYGLHFVREKDKENANAELVTNSKLTNADLENIKTNYPLIKKK